MSDLAKTYLRQARSFLRAGDMDHAGPLLERARVMAGNDRMLLADVLEELAVVYESTGKMQMAASCRERAARLCPPMPTADSGEPMMPQMPIARKHRLPWMIGGVLAAVLVVGGVVLAVVLLRPHGGPVASTQPAPSGTTSVTPGLGAGGPVAMADPATVVAPGAGTATPGAGGPMGVAPAAGTPGATGTAPSTAPVAAVTPGPDDFQDVLKDNVGLLVVMVHYEGMKDGHRVQVDIPLKTGTAFAIHKRGLMLTNRHVIEIPHDANIPVTLEDAGMPTVTLRSTAYVVCFGPDPKDQVPAKVVYASKTFDMAALRLSREFKAPLKVAGQKPRQGDDVLCCGYPGLVQQVLDQSANTPARIAELARKWSQNGHITPIDHFSRDSFNSTLTKGVVSAPERNIDSQGYLQTDAVVSPGNSGGPALNSRKEVVGIVTSTIKGVVDGKYTMALLMEQLHDELEPLMTNE